MEIEAYIKLQKHSEEKIGKAISNFRKSPKTRITATYLETRLEALEGYWKCFDTNHQCILIGSQDQNNDYFKEGIYDKVEECYMEYKTELKEALLKIQPQQQ